MVPGWVDARSPFQVVRSELSRDKQSHTGSQATSLLAGIRETVKHHSHFAPSTSFEQSQFDYAINLPRKRSLDPAELLPMLHQCEGQPDKAPKMHCIADAHAGYR